MINNLFNKVLYSNKCVVDNMKHIKINYSKLDEFVSNICIEESNHWLNELSFGISNFNIQEIINFLLIYHTIGFSYWSDHKWEVEYNSKKYDGAVGLICALSQDIKSNKIFLDFNYLSKLTYEEFERILKGNVELPLLKERYNNLIEVSLTVCEKMNGDFYSYVKDINLDIELFEIIINNFKSFEDVSKYNNEKVYYYKRAQLLVSDILHIKHQKQDEHVDYNNLLGCADYKIPQVLRDLDITVYDDKLSSLVDNKIIIGKDSEYEIEIRSTMLVVIDTIKNKLNNKYSSIAINDYIWLLGQTKDNIRRPYHRTRTTAY